MPKLPSIEPTTREEAPQVRQFLAGVFGQSADAFFLGRALFDWKAYAPRPDWPEPSRSYVLRSRTGLLASHGCVWPIGLVTPTGLVRALQIIDWAAAPGVMPGAGALLRRQIVKLVEVGLGVGGSADARRVMPRDGYRDRAAYESMALVLRPWAQFARRWSQPDSKRWIRLGRNTAWSLASRAARGAPAGWTVAMVARFDESAADPVASPRPGYIGCARPAALLNYILDFPGFPVKAARLLHQGQPVGHFLWCSINGQTRIIDFQLAGSEPAVWNAAARTATSFLAHHETGACELAVFVSLPLAVSAFAAAGFRTRRTEPLFVFDPAQRLDANLPIHLTAIDFDGFFLHSTESPFLT